MKSYKLVTDCYFPACIFKQFWISLGIAVSPSELLLELCCTQGALCHRSAFIVRGSRDVQSGYNS